jgi:hypothetical protein
MERLKPGEYIPRWVTKKRKLQSHVAKQILEDLIRLNFTKKRKLQSHVAKQILEDLIRLNLKYMNGSVERRRVDRRKGGRRKTDS